MNIFRQMLENLTKQAQATEPQTFSSGKRAPGAKRWRIFQHVSLAFTAVAILGCGSGSPASGTYSAECKPLQLIPGQTQEVELTLLYTLPSNPKTATTVSYGVQVTAPQGWSVAASNWEFSHSLKTTYMGVRDTRKLSVTVPADAIQGQHVLKLLISTASGAAQSVDCRFLVVSQGK